MNEMNILTVNGEQYEVADQKARKHNQNTAPAIPVTMTGTAVSTDMVSPVEHEVHCKVSGVDDLTAVTVSQVPNMRDMNTGIKSVFMDGNGNVRNLDGARSIFIPCKESTAYTLQKKSSARFSVAFTTSILTSGGKTQTTPIFANTDTVVKATSAARSKYIMIWYYYSASDPGVNPDELYESLLVFEDNAKKTFTPSSDGTVTGMKSIAPNMTILTDNPSANLEVTYNADTKKYIDHKFTELQSAILSTGGNV